MHVYASRCAFGGRFARSTALLCNEGIISESRMPPVRENGVVLLADNGGEDKDSQLPTEENKPMILANAGGGVHGEHSPEQALDVGRV